MVRIRIGEEERELDWDAWERRVRQGRVPPDALVAIDAITGGAFVRAGSLESYQSLRNDAALAWQSRFTTGPAPLLTAVLVGVNIRIWWLARIPEARAWLDVSFTNWAAPLFEDGESWRALTMGVLHLGLPHLAMNMLWAAYTGWNLERALGRVNLLVIYLASVLGGSLLSVLFSPESRSLGASGGVFGLVAATVVFGFIRTDILPTRGRRVFGLAMLPYLAVMFLSGLSNEGIDNWSHFGGLVTGGALALVLDPMPLQRRPGWNRTWWAGLGAGAGVLLLGLALLGPRLEPLEDHEAARERLLVRLGASDPTAGDPFRYHTLTWDVPAGWRMGVTSSGEPGFVSPSPRGDRAWAVREQRLEAPVSVEERGEVWAERVRLALPDATLGEPASAELAGRPGRTVRAELPGGTVLRWWGTARGLYVLDAVWEVDADREARLAPLARRLVSRVAWHDPEDLVQARAAVQRNPRTRRGRADLARALAATGEPVEAVRLYRELVEEEPTNPDWIAGLLEVAAWFPTVVPDVDGVRDRALSQDTGPATVLVVVDSLDAAAEEVAVVGLLELAWGRWYGDRTLRKARRRRGLPTELDAQTNLPRNVAVDPVTGARRSPEARAALAARPLTVASAREAGQERALLRARWAEEVVVALDTDPRSAVEPLFRLRYDAPPDDRAAALAELIEELTTLERRGSLRWLPQDLAQPLVDSDLLGILGGRLTED